MARRRHSRRGHSKGKENSIMKWAGKLLAPAAFGVAFVNQVSAKDIAVFPSYNSLSNTERAKFLGNSVIGHITGYNPFPQYGTAGITINPTGFVNKFTGLGVGLLTLSYVMPSGVGGKSLARKAGKGFLWGGIIGGLLDPATGARSGGRGGNSALAGIGATGSPASAGGNAATRFSGFSGNFTG
jgi:hypothetical protein